MAVTRRRSRPRYILAVLVLAAITLITIDARGSGGSLSPIRTAARDVWSPVERAAHAVLRPVGNFLTGAVDYGSLRAENQRLRREIAGLQTGSITAQAEQAQANQLLASAHLSFVGSIPTVAARVISLGSSNFETAVSIDRGTANGVTVGQPVVASGGLVGTISAAGSHTATVELLTDPAFAVGVRLDTLNTGTAQGAGQGRPMRILIDTPNQPAPKLTKGTPLVTSGLSLEKFPPGIPVGRVASSVTPPGASDPTITLSPIVDPASLTIVEVLLWSPQ